MLFIFRNDLSIRLVNHERAVHVSHSGSLGQVFGFQVFLPHVLGLVHVRVGVDYLISIPHRFFSLHRPYAIKNSTLSNHRVLYSLEDVTVFWAYHS